MAQDINYNKRIEVANTSSGGALQFFSVGKVTNGNLAKTANTKDEQTWDDDGFEKVYQMLHAACDRIISRYAK